MQLWVDIALGEYGETEITGSGHSSRILQYHATTTLKATSDEVPWCAAFVGWCLTQAGYRSTKSALARSYLKYGQELEEFQPGCIVVLARGLVPLQGHVGFGIKERDGLVYLLGGNQANKVCISAYQQEDVLGYRMPI